MILSILLLFAGFVLLLFGADWLVKGSASLAKRFGISELIIGLTIVAFGTSAPELVVNVVAAIERYNHVVLGNVIGSNIFNILVILGITAMVRPVGVQLKTIRNEVPGSIVAGLVVLLLANSWLHPSSSAGVSRMDGILLLLLFAGFFWYIIVEMRNDKAKASANSIEVSGTGKPVYMAGLILIGFAGLIGGGKLVVDEAVIIATELGLSERIIGLTIVSAGTSLPELATSAVAAYRGNSDLAIGNVVGSHIFNLLLILGVSAVIQPIPYLSSFNADMALYLAASLLILLSMLTGKKKTVDRWEGGLFFIIYLIYLFLLLYIR